MRAWARSLLAVLCVVFVGCGYIGEPLPPLLNIPVRVTDLTAVERGDRMIVQFTVPVGTTEGKTLRAPAELELRVGPAPAGEFDTLRWAVGAKAIGFKAPAKGTARVEIPVAAWVGKDVIVGVKATGPGGRDAGWSNIVAVSVVAALGSPAAVLAEPVMAGVRVHWSGTAAQFRVYRRAGVEPDLTLKATVAEREWVDSSTQYGTVYRYTVQAVQAGAESEPSGVAEITPRDVFPPAPPVNLTAIAAPASIDLVWERNTEADLAGYRIYRAEGDGKMERIGETKEAAAFGDRKIVAGKRYRYAVAAYDTSGNESAACAPVEVWAP